MSKVLARVLSGICAGALLLGPAPVLAQPAAALGKAPSCTPPPAPPRPAGAAPAGGPPPTPPPRPKRPVTAIPGVIAAGASWTKVWQQAANSSDGLIPDKDGNVLM